MEMTTIHPAESYLRNETNLPSLYVRIAGKRRRLFINRDRGIIGIIALGKRTKGYVFTDWASIEQIYYPSQEQDKNTDRKLILKYQKLARLATHTNSWLREIAMRIWIKTFTRTTSQQAHASTANVSDLPPLKNTVERQQCVSSVRH